jgi:DNA-binding HxlR family transcriptional regulator
MSFADELSAIGRNPNVAILSRLHQRALRLSELLDKEPALGEDSLNERLRELDRAGLVARQVDAGPPLRVLYALTPEGQRLAPTLRSLAAWVDGSAGSTR